ncbi:MAG: hypothetical protein AAF494_06155 [Pseudomonadota bacterium]
MRVPKSLPVTLPVTLALTLALASLAACKPPPTDAGLERDTPMAEPSIASEPLPSPDTEGAIWMPSGDAQRIVYGIPGEPPLMALACAGESKISTLTITRMSPADEGAGALMALIGNGAIGRLPIDATERAGRSVWHGELPAADPVWEPLIGPRRITATVPGAGMVVLNPSPLPMQLVRACRSAQPAL